jgi:hypothetical protein
MKFLNVIDGADKLKQDSNNRLVTDAEKTAWNGKQDALGYTPVNKAGDTMTGDLKVNGNIVAGTELIVGYNGTTESLQRHKWKYNGSTGYLELWRYSNQGKWELSATFPNRNTGLGGITVEGKQVATEDYVNDKVKTDVPAGAKFTDTVTTINGKTGAISKADIVALGIPAQDTVYTHPSSHPASMITENTSRRFVSDTEKSTWNSKADISDIPTKVSQLENDKNYVTQAELDDAGYGDMTKGVYDTNNNGKVDIAEVAETVVGNEIQLGGRFKLVYNDIEDSLDFEVI